MSCTSNFGKQAKQRMSSLLVLALWMSLVVPPAYSMDSRPTRSVKRAEPRRSGKVETPSPPTSVAAPNVATKTPDSSASLTKANEATQARVSKAYGRIPLSFQANQGQVNEQVKFMARGGGYNLFLTPEESVMVLNKTAAVSKPVAGKKNEREPVKQESATSLGKGTKDAVLRMKLVDANREARVMGLDELPGKSNYFVGNDPEKWRTDVPNYGKVKYEGVYPGVDMVYYGNQEQLEYDFIVAPGADPRAIKLNFEGAKKLRIDGNGDLVLTVNGGEVRQHKPVTYQEVEGVRQEVSSRYKITGKRQVCFELDAYDASKPLVIDPVLIYSTYLGGKYNDWSNAVTVDSFGNAYITGQAGSGFPVANAYKTTNSGYDAFVTKLNATGTAIIFSTYLGGTFGEVGNGIAVDPTGNITVTGHTSSSDFPLANALQPNFGDSDGAGITIDAFITKLNATGSALIYSTYLGGEQSDEGNDIAVDSYGNAYVVGNTNSSNLPTVNALQATPRVAYGSDAFVAKVNAIGSEFIYSTYFGGSGVDRSGGIAVDASGNAYITGSTDSNNFPTVNAFQYNRSGSSDAYVTKLNASGSALIYSTYLGGNGGEAGGDIAVDASGNAYVTGIVSSTNFPVVSAFQPNGGGATYDAFITKFDATGTSLLYSTYIGGTTGETGYDRGHAIAVDAAGNAYVTGYTDSTNFPTKNAVQPAYGGGGYDAFVTKLEANGTSLSYSTYIGGSDYDYGRGVAVDASGNAYVTGETRSSNFPTKNPYQSTYGTYTDAFLTKISDSTGHNLSGQIIDSSGKSVSGVTVTLSGSQTSSAQTDANGNYAFLVLPPGGNYTVTPSKNSYIFSPSSRTFNALSSDQTADFTVVTYTISGRVADANGVGMSEITVALNGSEASSTQTDANGSYFFANLPVNGNYTLTPSKTDPLLTYTATPVSRTFSSLSANQIAADFTLTSSSTATLYPVADAYVQDGSTASANFGAATPLYLQTNNTTGAGKNRDAYFKFDVSSISRTINSAKLRVYAVPSASGSISTSVYSVATTNWIESGAGGMTWNTKPARSSSVLTGATATVTGTAYATYEIDVTGYVKSEKAAGRNLISLALHNTSSSTLSILLNSREAAQNKPLLFITTSSGNNAPPAVSLTSPASGATYTSPANITLSATAADSDGSISKVDFYAGTTLIGTSSVSPYQIAWGNVAAGNYSLTAVAADNNGAISTSTPVSITVGVPNSLPVVSLTAPANDATYAAGSNIPMNATAADSDGAISKVEFFAGTTLIGSVTAPTVENTYGFRWNSTPAGVYVLTAKATDNFGGVSTSSGVNVKVVGSTGLITSADAYVRDGTYASTKFGTATELQAQLSATSGLNREAYLKFDISTISTAARATLRLYGRLSDATVGNVPVAIYPVSSTSWAESTITYSSKLTSGTTPLATATITDSIARWYEWDVTSYIQSEKSAGRSTVSFALKSTQASNPYVVFNSKEAGGNQPQMSLLTASSRSALMITASTTLSTAESAIKTRLTNLGFTVTVVVDKNASAASANGKSLVVISSTVTPSNVTTKFRNVPVPVINWEYDLMDDFGLTGTVSGTDYGTLTGQTQLSVINPTHPLAAGLSGTVPVATTATAFTWGKPNANATRIATLTSDATKFVIFGYEAGVMMPGLEAPGRRVGFFLSDTTAAYLTAGGGALFDAAVKWATEIITAPTIINLNPAFGAVGTAVTLTGVNFGAPQGVSTLTFNGVSATPTAWSERSITASVPIFATTGFVVVTVGGVESDGMTFAVGETDADADGLPDAWELQHFGNLDQTASGDPDGDGITNLQEYRQGRNPTKNAVSDSGDFINLRLYTPFKSLLP